MEYALDKDFVSFAGLKELLKERGLKVKWLAEQIGIFPQQITGMTSGKFCPKTDVLAKIGWVLKVPCSAVVSFPDLKPNDNQREWFANHALSYKVPEDAAGILTYAPFWELANGFIMSVNEKLPEGQKKDVNDLLDSIDSFRRNQGVSGGFTDEARETSLRARGIDVGHKSPRERHYVAKGLTPETRTKLRKDRPLNIRTVYEICKKLGCSVDWVLSYK